MKYEFSFTILVHSLLFCLIATMAIQAQNSASANIKVEEENEHQTGLQHTTIVVNPISESKEVYTEIPELKDLNKGQREYEVFLRTNGVRQSFFQDWNRYRTGSIMRCVLSRKILREAIFSNT